MITNESKTNQARPTILSATNVAWRLPPEELRLETGEAHVWLARLDKENTVQLELYLSEDECVRAERFRLERDKNRFVAARGSLRVLLGKYLKTNPRQIEFEYNQFGKPFLSRKFPSSIKFNVSHSENLALFAVARGREIGIDIERINASFIDEAICSYCLTRRELLLFRMLPKSERDLFFFGCWTRKEAYLKACGSGLSFPPNQIETSRFSESQPVCFEGNIASLQRSFSVQKIIPAANFAAALAIEGDVSRMKFWLQSSAANVR